MGRRMKKALAVILSCAMMLSTGAFASLAAPLQGNEVGEMRDITSQQLAEDMGLGYNIGNGLSSSGSWISKESPLVYERGWGNPNVTQSYIHKIREAGFKTIRVPVTWEYWLDENNQIDPAWMARVKEVVDWCMDEDFYVILNNHHDEGWIGKLGSNHDGVMQRYRSLWTQIAEVFRNYSDHLIFESMNEVAFENATPAEGFLMMTEMNQEFVNVIRASGGNNAKRHLLIAGYQTDPGKSTDERYTMPEDPANHLMLSIHYYTPTDFTGDWGEDVDWTTPRGIWGENNNDYLEAEKNFRKMADRWVKNGVPIIIGEYGAATSERKERESVVRFDKYIAETALKYGMCPVLWDDSNSGAIMLVDRNTGEFHWPELAEVYRDISSRLEAGQIARDGYRTSMYTEKSVSIKDNGELELGEVSPTKVRGLRFRVRSTSGWDGMGGGAIFGGDWSNTPSYQFDTLGQEVWVTFDDETRNTFGDTLQILIWWCNSDDGIDHKSELYIDKSSVKLLFDPGTNIGTMDRTYAAVSSGGGGGGGSSSGGRSSGGGGGSSSGSGTSSGNISVGNKDSLGAAFANIIKKSDFDGVTDEKGDAVPPSKTFRISDYLEDYQIGDTVKITADVHASGGYAAAIQTTTADGWVQSDQWGSNDSQVQSWTCTPTVDQASVILWYMDADWFMFNIRVELVEKAEVTDPIVTFTKDDVIIDDESGYWEYTMDISDYLPDGIGTGDKIKGSVTLRSTDSTGNWGSRMILGSEALAEWFIINEGNTTLSFEDKVYNGTNLKLYISSENLPDDTKFDLMEINIEVTEKAKTFDPSTALAAITKDTATVNEESGYWEYTMDISDYLPEGIGSGDTIKGSVTLNSTDSTENYGSRMTLGGEALAEWFIINAGETGLSFEEKTYAGPELKLYISSDKLTEDTAIYLTDISIEVTKKAETFDPSTALATITKDTATVNAESGYWEYTLDISNYLPEGIGSGDTIKGSVTLNSTDSTENYGSRMELSGGALAEWFIINAGETGLSFEEKTYAGPELKLYISSDKLTEDTAIYLTDISIEVTKKAETFDTSTALATITKDTATVNAESGYWEYTLDISGYLPEGISSGDTIKGSVTLNSTDSTENYGSRMELSGEALAEWFIINAGETGLSFEEKTYAGPELKLYISSDKLTEDTAIYLTDISIEVTKKAETFDPSTALATITMDTATVNAENGYWEYTMDISNYLPEGIGSGDTIKGSVTLNSTDSTENYGSRMELSGEALAEWFIINAGETGLSFEEKTYAGPELKLYISSEKLTEDTAIYLTDIHIEVTKKAETETTTLPYTMTSADADGTDWKVTIPFADLGVEGIEEGETVNVTVTYIPYTSNGGATLVIYGDNNNWWTNWTPNEENTFVCEEIAAGDMEVTIGGGLGENDSFVIVSVEMEKISEDDNETALPYTMTSADADGSDWKVTIPFADLGVEGIEEGETVNATVTYIPYTSNGGATLVIYGDNNNWWTNWTPNAENTFVCEGITAGDMEVTIGGGLGENDSFEIVSVEMEKVDTEISTLSLLNDYIDGDTIVLEGPATISDPAVEKIDLTDYLTDTFVLGETEAEVVIYALNLLDEEETCEAVISMETENGTIEADFNEDGEAVLRGVPVKAELTLKVTSLAENDMFIVTSIEVDEIEDDKKDTTEMKSPKEEEEQQSSEEALMENEKAEDETAEDEQTEDQNAADAGNNQITESDTLVEKVEDVLNDMASDTSKAPDDGTDVPQESEEDRVESETEDIFDDDVTEDGQVGEDETSMEADTESQAANQEDSTDIEANVETATDESEKKEDDASASSPAEKQESAAEVADKQEGNEE